MPKINVQCTRCQTATSIDASKANEELKCAACKESFRLNPDPSDPRRRTIKPKLDQSGQPKTVLPVVCFLCQQRFAIKLSMSGAVVACPVCKARLCFEIEGVNSNVESANDKLKSPTTDVAKPVEKAKSKERPSKSLVTNAEPRTKEKPPVKEQPAVKKKTSPAAKDDTPQTKQDEMPCNAEKAPHSGKSSNESDESSSIKLEQASIPAEVSGPAKATSPAMEKALKMLPPRYTVSGEVAEKVAEEIRQDSPQGIELGIDTMSTRIESGGAMVSVRSMSREEKQRRKSWRVTFLFTLGVIVLMVVFWLLLKQSGE